MLVNLSILIHDLFGATFATVMCCSYSVLVGVLSNLNHRPATPDDSSHLLCVNQCPYSSHPTDWHLGRDCPALPLALALLFSLRIPDRDCEIRRLISKDSIRSWRPRWNSHRFQAPAHTLLRTTTDFDLHLSIGMPTMNPVS